MSAKITLTGSINSQLRKKKDYYAFDMVQSGSKNGPKGCPTPSHEILFTVFVSTKAGKKAGLDNAKRDDKWLIQGELALDVPLNECPGEIGVVAFQIAPLELKEEKPEQEKPEQPIIQAEKQEVEVGTEPSVVATNHKVQTLRIDDINLPEMYRDAWLNPQKTQPVREWMQRHGRLDKPVDVTVKNGEYWLADGYRRFAIARELGFSEVPVRVV